MKKASGRRNLQRVCDYRATDTVASRGLTPPSKLPEDEKPIKTLVVDSSAQIALGSARSGTTVRRGQDAIGTLLPLVALLEGLPHVMFSLKDANGCYLAANQAFADRAQCRSPKQVIGRRAADLFAPELAIAYEAQDAVLRLSHNPVRRLLEVITRPDGSLGWYVTNKVLVPLEIGQPPVIAALSADEHAPVDDEAMRGIANVLSYIREHFDESITLAGLAEIGDMTPATLERRARRVLGLTPRQLIARTRLEEAVHRIVTTTTPLGRVALECGFFDQAAMNRQMRNILGVTPGSLRANSEFRTG